MSDKTTDRNEQFYDTFLKTSNALTGSLTRQELLKSILQEVKPLFNYHSAGLFVVYEKEGHHIDLTAEDPEIEPSDINYAHRQHGNVKMNHQGSSVDYCMQRAKETNGPLLLDYADLYEKFPDYPQFQATKKDGYRDCLVGLLNFQGKTLGMFCINALEKDFFPKEKFPLFQMICGQLAIAISNILDKEEIEQRELEKTRLLALSEPISKVRNRKELLKILYDHIREIFPFDDTGLFTLDDSGEHHIDWIVEDEITKDGAQILEAGVVGYLPHKGSVVEGMMQDVPTILNFEEVNQKHPGHPQYALMKQQGIKQFICRALFRESEKVGMLCFNSKREDFYSEKDFRLFDSIVNQINVAVLNILANEEILRREWEKTQLLKITERVSKLRNLPDFLTYVISGLKPIFNFYDVGIFIVAENGKHHFDLATLYPEISPSTDNHLLHKKLSGQLIEHPKSLVSNMIHAVKEAGGVKLFDFDNLKRDFPKYPQFELLNTNLRDCLAANLAIGDRTLGMFCMNKDQKGFFEESIFPFFKSVSEQLSVAISNILANDKLIVEKRFTEQLLEISESIAGIQDRRQLLEAFFTKVKSIIPYDEYGLFVLDKTGESHYELVDATMMEGAKAQKAIDKKFGAQAKYKHHGSGVDQIMKNDPSIYTVDELGDHPQLQIVRDAGLKQLLGGPLRDGERAFGMLCFNSFSDIRYTQRELDLFKPIAEQMATAVSKILADEEIQQREQEKTNLLKVSEAIASVKSREDLLKAMLDRIKPMVDYEDAVITIYESDHTHYRHFISSSPKSRKKDAQYDEIMGKSHPIKGTPDEHVLKELRKEGILFWETKAMKSKYPKHFIPDFLEKHNLQHNLYLRLVWNNELIGFLHFHFNDMKKADQSKSSFYQSIADQLSATVANIIANERLIKEKSFKETLLNITEAIVSIQDRYQLLKVIFERTKPVFGFHDVGLFVFDEEGNFSDWACVPEIMDTAGTQKISALNVKNIPREGSIIEWWFQKLKRENKVLLAKYTIEFFKDFPDYYQKQTLIEEGYKESITCILKTGGKDLGILMFNSLEDNFFSEKQYPLFEATTDQIATAVSNILAKEQVLEEKMFKETLLGISEAVAKIQTGSELMKVIVDTIQPIFNFHDIGLFVFNAQANSLSDWVVKYPILSDSEGSQTMAKDPKAYEIVSAKQGTAADFLLTKLNQEGSPLITNLSTIAKSFPDFIQRDIIKEVGYEDTLVAALRQGGRVLGFFCLNALEKDFFTKTQFPLFEAIADQLAVTVSNILANEQVLEEKQFKETLLGISEAVASINHRQQLLKVIFDKVNPLLPIDDVGVIVRDSSGEFWYDLAVTDNYHKTASNDGLKDLGYDGLMPMDSLMRYSFEQYDILDVDTLKDRFPDNIFLQKANNEVMNFEEYLFGPMNVGGKNIGSLYFDAKKKGTYNHNHLPLFRAIADQLAVAVSNILANEQVLEEKQFKETLLSISEAVATINDKPQLLKVIYERIQPVFPFDNAGLFIIDTEKDLIYEILDGHISPNDLQHTLTEQELLGPWKLSESNPKSWWMQDGLVIDSIARQMKYAKGHVGQEQFKEGSRHGLKQMIGGPLMANGKKIGAICFNTTQEDMFGEQDERLFKSVSEQIGIAVANILINEQVLEEKHISETLLSIGEGIATIRSKKGLINYIVDKLKPLFGFHDTGIIILDQQKENYTDWSIQYTVNASATGSKVFSYYEDTSGWNPVKDSSVAYIIDEINKTNKPTVFDWNGDWSHFSDNKLLSFSRGYDQSMVYLLKTGNIVLGTFWMNYQKGFDLNQLSLSLFQGICDQLAVAISNILANEQVLEEKHFKETLLDISEAVSALQERRELLETIFKIVKPIFPFDSTGLFVFDETGEYHIDLTVTEELVDELDEANRKIAQKGLAKVPRHPSVDVFMEKGPIIYLMDDLKRDYPDHPYYPYMKQKVVIGGPLINAGKPMGTLFFLSTEVKAYSVKDFPLFKAIADQLAVAVSNILANEQVLEEKRTTETLLSISEGIATIRSKKGLLSYIVEKLKPIFGFYDTGILVLDKEKLQYTDWSAFYKVDDSPTNLRIFEHYEDQTIWNPYAGSGVELAITASYKNAQPILFDWNKDWSHLSDAKIMSFLKGHAYDKSMVYPFKNGNELLGAFWINFRKQDDIDKVSKPLFQGICDQLAVAISNILANEEVKRRERLKSLQVEAVSIFNQDKDWDERFEAFIKSLQPHIPFHFASIDLWADEADYNRCKNIERIGSNEYRLWGPDDFERASGVPKKESSSAYSIARNWHFEERKTPVSQSKAHKTILKILNKIMDIEQHVDLSILLQDDRRFLLSLYKKGSVPYTPEQTALLQELSGSLGQTIEKALITEKVNELNQQLVEEKAYLQEEVKETYGFEEIVGESAIMQKVFDKVSEVSSINATVLILGETGTGKELIARAIHNNSPRRDRVLVKVNCAAIPSQIVESELFGHEKGAFTGAIKQRIGKFELANHGTIFLDEIGDMPMELQAKLLRVLQEREVERVGSNTMIKLDFRVIAATNKNLEELVAEGKFRADLFYRLNTFPLYLPALREREKDSELLAKHFARQFSQSLGLPFKGFSKKSLHNISTYEWPGNVRELQNVIEQAMILQKGKKLDISPHRTEKLGGARSTSAGLREIPDEFDMEYINAQKENLEKEYLMHMLEKTKWRVRGKGGAAELLDVHPNSLDYYLKKLGISKK